MVFSSSLFLLYFFPLFFITYYLTGKKFKNHVILLFSLFFYMWGAPLFLFVIGGSIILDFYLSHKIYQATGKQKKKWLIVSVCINLSILLYFKYANFFIENFNHALISVGATAPIRWTKIALPIGISFFTFHELSYIIDVYRGVNKPMKRLTDYAVYILLFPQLIAGPIIRFKEIAGQILDRSYQDNMDNRLLGFFRFVIGLSKKVLIANVLGGEADKLFGIAPQDLSSGQAWLGIIAYSFQIYFDFSGYSDMAIGMARMMGFIFPENFNNPYIAQNITDFWRRWHMSLSRWMRDYLYIPLGGNQVKSKMRLYLNLWIVFLISGFWHGASWSFVVWGAYHGFFLIADRIFLIRFMTKIGKTFSIMFTYLIVLIGWVFFRANTVSDAVLYIEKMFSFTTHGKLLEVDLKVQTVLFIALLVSFAAAWNKIPSIQDVILFEPYPLRRAIVFGIVSIVMLMLCTSAITSSDFNPFIYYRF